MKKVPKELLRELSRTSGPLQENTGKRLYGSFHFPGFTHAGIRNTLQRLRRLGVPKSLEGKTVLDIGSNTGAIACELARRGAKVVGMEFNSRRVDLCNELAGCLKIDAQFFHVDMNEHVRFHLATKSAFQGNLYDLVFCLAVDAYVDDRFALYDYLTQSTADKLYLESNYPSSDETDPLPGVETIKDYFRSDLRVGKYIGQSTTNGRRLFIFSRSPFEFRRKPGRRQGEYFVKQFFCYDEWAEVKAAVELVADMAEVPETTFPVPRTMHSKIIHGATRLDSATLNDQEISSLREQLFRFVREINRRGVAHRDLQARNCLVKDGKLYVIDWEFATANAVPFEQAYDITGKGCEPCGAWRKIGAQTLFSKKFASISLDRVLRFTKSDLLWNT